MKKQACINKDLSFDINWKGVRAQHRNAEFTDVLAPPPSKAQVLFKTHFSNNTSIQQEYPFTTEGTTCSSCDVAVEKGLLLGWEMNVKLRAPSEILGANAGSERELSLPKPGEEMFQEELAWVVESQIKVPPMHKATAELVMTVQQRSCKFMVESCLCCKIHVSVNYIQEKQLLCEVCFMASGPLYSNMNMWMASRWIMIVCASNHGKMQFSICSREAHSAEFEYQHMIILWCLSSVHTVLSLNLEDNTMYFKWLLRKYVGVYRSKM